MPRTQPSDELASGSRGDAVSLWITEAEVVRRMDMKGAIAALDRGLALEAAGKAENMVKTHAIWGGHHTLHAIGATFADEGFVGTKTWAHANGAAPLLILFDSHNGSLRAISEAFALVQLRPGGDLRPGDQSSGDRGRLRHGADRHRQAGDDAARRGGRRASAAAGARLQPRRRRQGRLRRARQEGAGVERRGGVLGRSSGRPSRDRYGGCAW